MTDIKIGDKVVMNSNYFVEEIDKGRIWTVCSEPWYCCGTLVVKLEGWSGGYAVDGLDLVDESEEEKMSKTELKPCPFCGGKAVFFVKDHATSGMKSFWRIGVYCTKCNLTSPKLYSLTLALGTNAEIQTIEDERQHAVDDWNRRADNA